MDEGILGDDEDSMVESDDSLSKWKGTCTIAEHNHVCPCHDFNPIPLDLYTASSIGHIKAVKDVLNGYAQHTSRYMLIYELIPHATF